jgi:hypothetical protein
LAERLPAQRSSRSRPLSLNRSSERGKN